MKYLIEHLNGGEPIINPTVRWTFAGFYTDRDQNVVLHIEFKTDEETFSESFTASVRVGDRSDQSIDEMMNELLKPYIIK